MIGMLVSFLLVVALLVVCILLLRFAGSCLLGCRFGGCCWWQVWVMAQCDCWHLSVASIVG